ncbi:SURF1 family cytochrome oxidase biogenesis protein, partial [Acidovorax sp. SD340]
MPFHPTAPVPQSRRLRQAVLAVVGIALFLGFIALGTWQVQRRAWKLALIERVDQRVHAAPVP